MKKTMRTTKGLADVMFEELDALREGKSTPQQARAKTSVANAILTTKRLELEVARFVSLERMTEDASIPCISLAS